MQSSTGTRENNFRLSMGRLGGQRHVNVIKLLNKKILKLYSALTTKFQLSDISAVVISKYYCYNINNIE